MTVGDEMDPDHRKRASDLLYQTGMYPGSATTAQFLAAYQAVLMKDLLWTTSELLTYKQNEVHR